MNMDPSQHPQQQVPDYEREVIARDIESSTGGATSSITLTSITVVAAVALIAGVITWSPWGGSNGTAPGQGGQDISGELSPGRDNPTQPQVIPTTQRSPR